jgi:hypothetical protein
VLDRYFALSERGATIGGEVRGGLTTFMVIADIIFVNPGILSFAGIPALAGQGPPLRRFKPRPALWRASSSRGRRPWASCSSKAFYSPFSC